jgi:hypothetical protein
MYYVMHMLIVGGTSRWAGDTLFALGCGRLFEGHPEMMWTSLSKLLPLPRDTLVYCAHEYTQSNARFAVHIDPSNTVLAARKQAIDDARSKVGRLECRWRNMAMNIGPSLAQKMPYSHSQMGLYRFACVSQFVCLACCGLYVV